MKKKLIKQANALEDDAYWLDLAAKELERPMTSGCAAAANVLWEASTVKRKVARALRMAINLL